jgi:hypothetical protein
MTKNKITAKILFLIKNESEYQSVNNFIGLHNLTDYDMLSIKSEYPYLVDDFAHNQNVSQWQKYDVTDLSMSRYWLEEYKTIEEIITTELARDNKYQNQIIESQHFTFGLVLFFGRQNYEPITVLDKFFSNNNFRTVCFHPTDNFIDNLICSFTSHYDINCQRLPL